jgi:hypothetical protein
MANWKWSAGGAMAREVQGVGPVGTLMVSSGGCWAGRIRQRRIRLRQRLRLRRRCCTAWD